MIAIDINHFPKCLLLVFLIAWSYLGVACSGGGSGAIIPARNGASTDDKQTKDETNSDQTYNVEEEYGKSSRGRIGSLETLVLVGTYEEIGRAHGVLAGRKILDMLNGMLVPFVNDQEPGAWDSYLIPQAKQFKFPEPYERELQGIIDGIREKFPDSKERMLTSLNREISIDDLHALNCFIDIYLSFSGCSSFSAWGSLTRAGEVISGRNLDERYISSYKPVFMIVARRPTELQRMATMDVTGPGIIGVTTCMNEDGIMIMGHDEQGLKAQDFNKWIPRSIVLREAIETLRSTSSIDTLKKFFENRPVKAGNSAHFSRPRKGLFDHPAVVIEWDGNAFDNSATIRLPKQYDNASAIVCTNHYVGRRSEAFPPHGNSVKRYRTLVNYLTNYRDANKSIDLQDAVEMMDSVAVNDLNITYCSIIAFPQTRELYIAISPEQGVSATQSQWALVTWNMVFGTYHSNYLYKTIDH